ncbi:hypothetical protein L0664_13340 [Octadecabacter sp. G9-8]|uniref:Prepilin type IV endopeptidase peptidase domain-containing protein n=1 Tax=Octadecabacter dasysiphoniae TaxID=2909341 RepID=A0ABS9CY32_9RHOB|nr:hypothetical protein [Octadecabacter dasysiphoniae]MCF2872053.1 hypothetical protein [Octadecabacter dasysiphoniae]
MSSLTLGLIGVAYAFVFDIRFFSRVAQVVWLVCVVACLVVFLSNPPPFVDVTFWAVACAGVWALARSGHRPALMFAGVAGFLIGASAPFVAVFADPYLPDPATAAVVCAWLVAVMCGAVLAGPSGGALALMSGGLVLGCFGLSLTISTALAIVAPVAAYFGRRHAGFAVTGLALVPVFFALGGLV